MANPFGTKIRVIREQLDVSQTAFAQMLGINQASLSNMESGRRPPSLALAIRIAGYLGVSTDYLLRDNISVASVNITERARVVRERQQAYGLIPFGEKLRRLRSANEVSQLEFAQALGLTSHAHVSLLERDRKKPSIELLIRIADYFQLSIDTLIAGTFLSLLEPEETE